MASTVSTFLKNMAALAIDLARSPSIFCVRDGFKMIWIYASWRSAQMVDLKTFGDRPNIRFVTKTVRVCLSAVDAQDAISSTCFAALPDPAIFRDYDVRQDA